MANITTTILYEDEIKSLNKKYAFLENIDPESPAFRNWNYKYAHPLGYKKIKKLSIIFIGQTGYGKSSLINKLIHNDIFKTSDYQSCTKGLHSADYFLHHRNKAEKVAYSLSFIDLPGIGENDKADRQYLNWYQNYIKEASVIIYLFRADKRDHSQDEFFFNNVFDKKKAHNLICVLSQADKIEPINRDIVLSDIQKENLKKKKQDIRDKSFLDFGDIDIDIVPVSTHLDINIEKLEDKIISKLKEL
ncbi:MAG: dynamin family protein [Sulfurimonas sp.]|nr:dynamin family protein [Sulfurimonas sp.]